MENSTGPSGETKGSGIETTESRSVSAFRAVTTTLPFDVAVNVGQPTKVTLIGDDNILPLIKTSSQSGMLSLSTEKPFGDAHARVVIETPSLDAVNLGGSGSLELQGVETHTFTADLSGSGDITAKGKVKTLRCSLSGSGNMNMESLHAGETTANLSGSGNIDTYAADKLTTDLSGSGNIRCSGNPKSAKRQKTGSGNIEIE